MSCEKCRSFGGTRSSHEYLGIDISRHAELYRCRNCGQFLEIVAEARAPYFLTLEQAEAYFPDAREALEKTASRK
jgi:hypothetical protein